MVSFTFRLPKRELVELREQAEMEREPLGLWIRKRLLGAKKGTEEVPIATKQRFPRVNGKNIEQRTGPVPVDGHASSHDPGTCTVYGCLVCKALGVKNPKRGL